MEGRKLFDALFTKDKEETTARKLKKLDDEYKEQQNLKIQRNKKNEKN